jgi:hypothetical protein
MANRSRATLLPLCQRLLLDNPRPHAPAITSSAAQPACFRCPKCATPMLLVEKLSPWSISQLTLSRPALDSS